jgi:xanthine dehydrogenase accessory factor
MTGRGTAVGRAVVTRVWGSAPRSPGACLLADAEGNIAGSVSGGCIESAAAEAIGRAIRQKAPAALSFGVSNETAWEVGLTCGGTIEVFVEPTVRPQLIEAARGSGGVVLATVVRGDTGAPGSAWLIDETGATQGPLAPAGHDAAGDPALGRYSDGILGVAADVARGATSRTETIPGPDGALEVFFELIGPQPRLIIFGAVHIAIPLVDMARPLGYQTIVADARPGFLTEDRFPGADRMVLGWPAEVFDDVGLDRGSFVVVLTHDPKLDDPALEIALRSPARYVGALGSRKTQRARRERLLASGLSRIEVDRLHGPVGLNLGGRAPAETALAILAEMTAVRYGTTDSLAPTEGI